MNTDTQTADSTAPKKLTITLTDHPPVKIVEDQWPIVAEGKWDNHDGKVECQANRRWLAWLKVRQHADGRTIVYGRYSYSSQWQGEEGIDAREGQMVTPAADDYPETARKDYWVGQPIIDAIREVGERLHERSDDEHWSDVIAETIADMPAQELACSAGEMLDEQEQANARLIAAAPELLEELEKMTNEYAKSMKDAGVTYYPEALFVVRQARKAIAKAKGNP